MKLLSGRFLCITLLLVVAATAANSARGQSDPVADAAAEFEQLDARYRQILSRNPKPGPSFDRWYRLHLDAGRLKELVEDCRQRVQDDPESSADQILLALVCARTGDVNQALEASGQARRLSPQNYVPALLQGELYQQLGRNAEAATVYAEAVELKPPMTETIVIARRLTRMYFVAGNSEQALQVWSDIERRFPRNVGILTEVAQQLAEHRQFEEAIERWEQIRSLTQRDLDLRLTAGIEIAALEAQRGRPAEAVARFDQLLNQVRPDSWQAGQLRQKIENVLLENDGFPQLIKFLETRLEGHPDEVDTRAQLAFALERTGNLDAAEGHYRQAIKQAPGRSDLREMYIESLEARQKIDEAVAQARLLTESDPQDVEARELYGRLVLVQNRSGDPTVTERDVAEIWNQIPAIRPRDAQLAVQTAELCRSSASWPKPLAAPEESSPLEFRNYPLLEAAGKHYQQGVQLAPDNSQFRVIYGEFLHACGHRNHAVEVWSEIVRPPFDTVANQLLVAQVFRKHGDLDRAISAAREGFSRDSQSLEAARLLVDILGQAERFEEALSQIDAILEDLSDDPRVQAGLRKQWVDLTDKSGQTNAAVARLEARRSEMQAGAEELWRLGLLYDRSGESGKAAEILQSAVEIDPDNAPLRRDFAEVLLNSQQLQRAVAQYYWIVENSPNGSIPDYERIIDLETGQKHYEEARQAALAILRITPSNPEGYRRLSAITFQMKRYDEALNTLRHAVRLAPSDPAFRLELIQRLADLQQHHEALEHCWHCFDLVNSQEDRLSLVGVLMSVARAGQRVDESLARLRELRDQQKHSQQSDYTWCLIAAYRHAERAVLARAELEKLLVEHPEDRDALRQMVEVMESVGAWPAVARWQSRLVELDPTAEDLQKLVTYYRRAGDNEQAEAAWHRYVRSLSPRKQSIGLEVALQLIDAAIQQSDYTEAQQLAEWSLNQLPDSSPLRFRLALTLLVRRDYAEAGEAFEAAIRTERVQRTTSVGRPQGPVTSPPGTSPEILEIQVAKRTYPNLSRIGSPRWNRRNQTLALQQALKSPATEIEAISIIGSYVAAEFQDREKDWIGRRDSVSGEHPELMHDAVLAIAASGRLTTHLRTTMTMIARQPDDPLPYLAYLLHHYDIELRHPDQSVVRAEMLNRIQMSFQWIGEHRPDLRDSVVLNYARQLVVLNDKAAALTAYVETLRHPDAATRNAGAVETAQLQLAADADVQYLIEPSGLVPALVALLKDGSTDVAISATKTLGGLGQHAEPAIAPLIELFSHPNAAACSQAALALADIGPASVPQLIEVLESDRHQTRLFASDALRQLGTAAAPAVPALVEVAASGDSELQLRAMQALGSIGSESKDAVPVLMRLLESGSSELQCQAMVTLGQIGPDANAAVPLLIGQLKTDNRTHQRNAARCLGLFGAAAGSAVPELRQLLEHEDLFVRRISLRALRQIDSGTYGSPGPDPQDATAVALHGVAELDVGPLDWPQWGGWSGRNSTPQGTDIPDTWDLKTGRNIKWTVPLGSQTYGPPAVANGKIFVGTNNGHGYLARFPNNVDLGVLLCLDEQTGQFLWQLSCPKLPTGRVHDWPLQGIPSTPLIDGDRLWLVTNRGEVVCLDTEGFRDGQNDGPYRSEPNQNNDEADIVWSLDMMGQLGVSQHNMANCSMTCAGDLLFVCTSNGVDVSHLNLPAPNAPSFMALDRWTGKVLWTDASPGTNILHGQWCSPCYAVFDGVPQVIFGGGDGWLYSFAPEGDGKGNSELIWKFDCNPKDSKWVLGGRGTRNNIIAFPAVYDGLVYVAVGQDPEHGEGAGHLWCIDPTGQGDVSHTLAVDASGNGLPHRRLQAVNAAAGERIIPNPNSAVVWHFDQIDVNGDGRIDYEEEMHRTTATPVIKDGLVYVADFSGIVYCLDAKYSSADLKPKLYWTHDMYSPSWDSPLVVDGKVYVGDEDGDVTVFRHGKQRELLNEIYMENSIKSAPIVANNVLYITTLDHVYAIEKTKKTK